MKMRPEVVKELDRRIDILKSNAKPNDVGTGMSGSFLCFCMWMEVLNKKPYLEENILDKNECISQEEWDNNVYDDYLRKRHIEIYEEINGKSWHVPPF